MLVVVATFFRPLCLAPGTGLIVVAMLVAVCGRFWRGIAAGGLWSAAGATFLRPRFLAPGNGVGVIATFDPGRRGLRRKHADTLPPGTGFVGVAALAAAARGGRGGLGDRGRLARL